MIIKIIAFLMILVLFVGCTIAPKVQLLPDRPSIETEMDSAKVYDMCDFIEVFPNKKVSSKLSLVIDNNKISTTKTDKNGLDFFSNFVIIRRQLKAIKEKCESR